MVARDSIEEHQCCRGATFPLQDSVQLPDPIDMPVIGGKAIEVIDRTEPALPVGDPHVLKAHPILALGLHANVAVRVVPL